MKNKKRAQLSEQIYFSNQQDIHPKKLIQEAKQYIDSIPHIKIVNDLLKEYFTFISYPIPFKTISQKKNYQQINSIDTQCQFINKLKKKSSKLPEIDAINGRILKEIIDIEDKFLPQSKYYGNNLLIEYDFNNMITLKYITTNYQIKTITINNQCQLQQQSETQLKCKDRTGIYEVFNNYDLLYTRHMYSVELFKESKSYEIFQSKSLLKQILYNKYNKQLYLLSNEGIRTLDSYIWKPTNQVSLPYQIQQITNHHNPNCLLLSSFANVKIYDLRQSSLNSLISQEQYELLHNRFYAIHQLSDPRYLMAFTNRNIQYYDIRAPNNILFKQRHNCSEIGLEQIVKIKQPIDLLNKSQLTQIKNKANSEEIQVQQKGDELIAYSPQKRGQGIFINFESKYLQQNEFKLCTIANHLAYNSYQYCCREQVENGIPTLLATSSIFNKRLRIRGFQGIRIRDKLMIFSLDQQDGIGLQIFDNNMDPIKLNSDVELMKNFNISFKQNNVPVFSNLDQYDKLFSDSNSFLSEDLELEEIPELKKKEKKKKKFDLQIQDYPYLENTQNEEQIGFEDQILFNHSATNQDMVNPNPSLSNNQFILTQSVIDSLI